jgi:hypothetical protein
MTRVTPLQFPFISLSSAEGRYEPIRTATQIAEDEHNESSKGKESTSQSRQSDESVRRERVSGNIVILRDTKSSVEGKYIELDNALWPKGSAPGQVEASAPEQAQQSAAAAAASGSGAGAGGEAVEEAEMPEPFEYPFEE